MKFYKILGVIAAALCSCFASAQLVSIPIPGSPLSLTVMANPQPLQEIKNNPLATAHNLGDDGHAGVPLPFTFPFYGQNFTNSTMYSNGAVQFGANRSGSNNAFCCQGLQLSSSMGAQYNHSIVPLWTDLIGSQGSHYTLGTSNTITYGWYGVNQYGQPNSRSSFEVSIDSTGGIDMRWAGAVVTAHPVTIGTIGDASRGEFTQNYYSPSGINITGLTQLATGPGLAVNLCFSSPLSDPSCPGYADALLSQQCSVNPLYDQRCVGYAAAYFGMQCSMSALYNEACPGYAAAYHTQQCSIDTLYAPTCPGYSAAYKAQQCRVSPLYASDCPGYATAYHAQQCTISPLYASDCPGYATAYKNQQCSLNPLFMSDCPGYAEAYFNQQCRLDSLYDRRCEGYATAYSVKYLIGLNSSTTSAVNSTLTSKVETARADPSKTVISTSLTGEVSAAPQLFSDTNVNNVITSTPSTTSQTSPTSVARQQPPSNPGNPNPGAQLGAPGPSAEQPPAQQAQKQEEKKTEEKKVDNAVAKVEKDVGGGGSKDSKSNANREKIKEGVTAKAKELANDVNKANNLEAQVAAQSLISGLIAFVPGFDAYNNSTIRDVNSMALARQYGQPSVDNRSALRQLNGASDRMHREMVESQYKR